MIKGEKIPLLKQQLINTNLKNKKKKMYSLRAGGGSWPGRARSQHFPIPPAQANSQVGRSRLFTVTKEAWPWALGLSRPCCHHQSGTQPPWWQAGASLSHPNPDGVFGDLHSSSARSTCHVIFAACAMKVLTQTSGRPQGAASCSANPRVKWGWRSVIP